MNTTSTTLATYQIVINLHAVDAMTAAFNDFVASGDIWVCCLGVFLGYFLKGIV